MKKIDLKYKIILIIISGASALSLLFFSVKYNWDTTYILRDIFYFPINIVTSNSNKIVFENRCLELQEEVNELKKLLEINNSLSDFSIVSSTVINRNTSYWNNELTINKGRKDNIKKGMAVIDSNGLIGRIEHVSFTTSIVKLITNYNSNNKISVKIWTDDNTSINKVLETDSNNNLIISGIDNNFDIKEGMKVTTSGLSDIYPSGINIGTIDKIEDDKFGISKKAYVKHSGDLNNIRFVSVLIRG